MSKFTNPQEMAIHHNEGPMIVLAGPGSGKTLVITYRTKNLIEEYGIKPGNILVITFTRAAAGEMKERFTKLMDGQNMPVTFGTFHAIFFKILKYAYNYSADNILREDEKYQIIKELVEEQQLELDDINEFVNNIISEISMVKGDMISVKNYYSKSCAKSVFSDIYMKYDKKLQARNKIDFDDMLILCYQLLSQRKDILELWQNKYKYILVDEFQDINRIQYEIVKMLALPENNLFIVGDDDQSIYGFRGARPEIMLNFPNDYKKCIQVLLDKNFRSGYDIVNASLRLIGNNTNRFEKEISAASEKSGKISYINFENHQEENIYVINEINKYIKDGLRFSDIAVLCRTNLGPRFLVEKLMEYNIPFNMKDAMPNIYEHWITKDLFTYINVAHGSKKRADYLQIINRPNRYISRNTFPDSEVNFDSIYFPYQDKQWMVDRISKFEYDLKMLEKMPPYAAIHYIRNEIGYDSYLKDYAMERQMDENDLIGIAEEILEISKGFEEFNVWNEHIHEYTEELKKQKSKDKNKDMVEIATMHSSKGLEYKVVFLIDVNEGVVPHSKAVMDSDMEEERRMFYVAVTRAKERLHVYSVDERFNKPVAVSRFVGEMLYEFESFSEGREVVHKKYGDGVIENVSDGKVKIYFSKLRKNLVFDLKFAVSNGIIKQK